MTAVPTQRRPPRPRERWLRRLALLGLVALPTLLWSCFPGPIPELWPPRPGEPRYEVDVVYRDWHTLIVLPTDVRGRVVPAGAERGAAAELFKEWEYCEKGWYLEGRQGFLGVPGALRALLWPTASGVASRSRLAAPWTRHAGEDVARWSFVVSEAGLQQMQDYLETQKGDALVEFPGWYQGTRSYCLFHHCHHFTAAALRAAGLPIRPWWAFSAWLIEIQLDRVVSYHEEAGL